jgi:uncharacterized protein YqeY
MIVEQIKKDMVQAMKDKDTVKRDILRVLKGEFQRDFITEDDAALKKIKKLVTNLKDSNGDQIEIDILEAYLPEQLSTEELTSKVKEFMGHFSKNYTGLYDGKELSTIVKSLLG